MQIKSVKLLLSNKLLVFGATLLLSTAMFSFFSNGVAHADLWSAPTSLAADGRPTSVSDAKFHLSTQSNDSFGNGAFVDKATVKVYSRLPAPTDTRTIRINLSGPPGSCTFYISIMFNGSSYRDQDKRTDDEGTCGIIDYNIPAIEWDSAPVVPCDPGYQCKALDVTFLLWTEDRVVDISAIRVFGDLRLGIASGYSIPIDTANTGGEWTFRARFGVPCNVSSPAGRIFWRDDDFRENPEVHSSNPVGDNMEAYLRREGGGTYGTVGSLYTGGSGDGFGGRGIGRMNVSMSAKQNYELEFINVNRGNAINLEYPYDSINFYTDCDPDSVPPDISCQTFGSPTAYKLQPHSRYRFSYYPNSNPGTLGSWATSSGSYIKNSDSIYWSGNDGWSAVDYQTNSSDSQQDYAYNYPDPTANGWIVKIERWEHVELRDLPTPDWNGQEWRYTHGSYRIDDCYVASCQNLTINGPKPAGGDGSSLIANNGFIISGSVTNMGKANLPVHIFVDGVYTGYQDVGWVNRGTNGYIYVGAGPPRDEIASRALTVRVVYGNAANNFTVISCPITVNTYKRFDINPSAQLIDFDSESPEDVDWGASSTHTGEPVRSPYFATLFRRARDPATGSLSYPGYDLAIRSGSMDFNGSQSFGPYDYDDPVVGRGYRAEGGQTGTWAPGDQICSKIYITHAHGWVGPSGLFNTTPDEKQSCPTITNRPYVSVYGNDVSADGGGLGEPCVSSGSGIQAYTKSGGAGSGVQLASYALGQITGFKSAFLRASVPSQPSGLTFSNTNASSLGNFGAADCATDYYTQSQYGPSDSRRRTDNSSSINLDDSGISNGGQTFSQPAGGRVTLTDGEDFNKRHTLFVDGDVFIDDNITYANTGGWANMASIPYLTIIARGNIYISQSVDKLDGRFIAQPRDASNGGHIYTCTKTVTGALFSEDDLWTECGGASNSRRLVIHGQFVAKTIHFLRTINTLSSGSLYESASSSNAAEVFEFSPEIYLGQPATRPSAAAEGGEYEYITTLPPIL